jgi:hypothetical protein
LIWPAPEFQRLLNTQSAAPEKQPESAPLNFRVANALLMGILIGALLGIAITFVAIAHAQTFFRS